MCVSGCPYKKIYYNWTSGKAEKCTFYIHELKWEVTYRLFQKLAGSYSYLGVLLYDADKIEQVASVENPQDLYEAQLAYF